ncbi:glutathione S-transferase [Variovorax saccharolyticus]|uniref:glutathione S-transferase n=1 Tax=Variovorax saccharolyticus TaxID=3053516 RepID=UPI0025790EA3|nr:glutathione S-transferase [Variovorax sp. J31P216]MDM0023700.1 glutathione S-transferase [Variovorax sp. J31P216]
MAQEGDPQTDLSAAALPVLYSFRRCPYAMRARMAITVSGQRCELREVVLRDKPADLLAASAKGTVPVLVDTDGRVIDQSLDIMLWALERNDPDGWLRPARGTLNDMLALIAECDGGFKRHLDGYKYPDRPPGGDTSAHRACGAAFLEELEARLRSSRCLHGDHAALSDIAIAPFVRQFAQVDTAWFDAQPWPRLRAWLAQRLGATVFTRVMDKYPVWRTGEAGVGFPAD